MSKNAAEVLELLIFCVTVFACLIGILIYIHKDNNRD